MSNVHQFQGTADLEQDWFPILVSPTGILVSWTEKYGPNRSEECIGLWENKEKYRLTYRDSRFIEVLKANVNSMECVRVGDKSGARLPVKEESSDTTIKTR